MPKETWNSLIPLRCGVQHYPWGGRTRAGRPPFIATLLGEHPEPDTPYAELWIGAHPRLPAQAQLPSGERALDQFVATAPRQLLGLPVPGCAANRIPFLLKVLNCEKPLSIQAHPDRELARDLHRRDPEHYPDANHKPEIAVALTPFRALCRFRERAEIRDDLRRVPALRRYFRSLLSAKAAASPNWLRRAYALVFTAPDAVVSQMLSQLHGDLRDRPDRAPADECTLELLQHFPDDRGVLAAYFLNLVTLRPGEALFLGANEPHAYLHGTIVECMANSDNVVRAGLTPKFVDREVLLGMLRYDEGRPALLAAEEIRPGAWAYRPPVPEFRVEFWRPAPGQVTSCHSDDRISLLLVLDGAADLQPQEAPAIRAATGSAWLWPAALDTMQVVGLTPGTRIVRATPNPVIARTARLERRNKPE